MRGTRMRGADLRLIHISDLHILADPDRRQYGVDTAAVLREAVDAINRERPDLVIASGDLAGDESEDAYRRLQALLAPLESPIRFLPGNHDSRTAFRRVFRPGAPATADPLCEAFEHAGERFVLLDSTEPGKEEGVLPPDRLAWLERELTAHPRQPTWIFLHHQPLPIYIRWLDRLGLADPEPLLALLGRHPQVRAVGYGHVHQARSWRYGKAHFFSAPALAFQFSSINQEPEVTREAPGFRLVELAAGEARHRLHYLDGRVVPEPCLNATPIYVR
ncbi:MAG: phosphodiesterase [Zetaproteobacteria bacterium]|nr:MAG: phosphodiesterase [Zetaproteobacteria bacterium]